MIVLDENFHVDMDTNNVVLRSVVTVYDAKKKKDVTSKSTWYCKDLGQALKIFTAESLKTCKDIKELQDKLTETQELIKKLCHGITQTT